MTICQALTRAGQPCRCRALAGGLLCLHHDPGRTAARAEARKRAGLTRRALRGPAAALQIVENLNCALLDGKTRPMSPSEQAEAIALIDGQLDALHLLRRVLLTTPRGVVDG